MLTNYYDKYEKEFTTCLFTEKNFGTSLTSQIHLDDIALTGKVDRIELISPSLRGADATRQSHTTKDVRVIDYKTGKSKTRNEIEGNTKNSDGDYKRQLTFYQLLSELDKSFQYEVKETQIDFIEPDAQNNFHRENFIISTEDVSNLKKEIKDSVAQIRNLDFTRTEDLTKCATCPFKSHCLR